MTAVDSDPAVRQAFREFVRHHHPDRGGDPATFVAGLAAYGRGATVQRPGVHSAAPAEAPLTFYRRARGAAIPLSWFRAWRAERARRTRAPRVR